MTDLNKGGPALFFTPISCVHSLFALQTQTFFFIPVKFTAMGFDAEICFAFCASPVMDFYIADLDERLQLSYIKPVDFLAEAIIV